MPTDPRILISKATDIPANDETPEVEGHGFKAGAVEPPVKDSAEDAGAEVDGHMLRIKAVEQPSDSDAPVEDEQHEDDEDPEVQGHRRRFH